MNALLEDKKDINFVANGSENIFWRIFICERR